MTNIVKNTYLGLALGGAALALMACGEAANNSASSASEATPASTAQDSKATVDDAIAYIKAAEEEMQAYSNYASRIYWVRANFITQDTNFLVQQAAQEGTEMGVRLANGTKPFEGLELPFDVQRKMDGLRSGLTLPAPETEGSAAEMAAITTRLGSAYSTGTIELDGEQVALDDLEVMMGDIREPARLKEIWTKWRDVSPPMKDDYERLVEIANSGAQELGFRDVADLWLSKYDMPSDDMAEEVDRLWAQVEPLYRELHCHTRARLSEAYGDIAVPTTGPIRADLLGNMWAQTWGNIYPLIAPEGSDIGYDLTELLLEKGYTPIKMVETGDEFFQSLGIAPLPDTFWERSLITKPQDRTVVCHASAWNLDDEEDIRIKMCTKVNADDFQTVHHELGHNIYQRAYNKQDYMYRTGAHDGFHEAIGDFIALSITPEYLVQIGLLDESQLPDASKDVGLLMNQALDKIAFLPFGLLMDKWRWGIFKGEITPDNYNEAWWDLRLQYQGIVPPVERGAAAFDPGAKYHIPNNVPYLRYFLSFIMQFQFHKAACEMAGWEGPLHRCSIYGNKEVGAKFNAMMEMGSSQPWPDTLELFTGTREMDGSAVIEYFDPLMVYLKEQNEGRTCGW